MNPAPVGLLRLRWGVAVAVAIAIGTSMAVFALATLGAVPRPWMDLLALVVFIAALALAVRPDRGRYPLPWAVVVVGAGVAVNLLMLWNLPVSGWPGYVSWNFGAVTWLSFVLAFRGRVALAWIGLALLAVTTLVWVVSVGRPPVDTIGLVVRHVGTLLIATLFNLLLNRAQLRIRALQSERVTQVAGEAAAVAELRERSVQGERLEAEARPVLEQLARGEAPTVARRVELRALEASLRDGLRGGALVTAGIAAEASRARARGAVVVLLDDRREPLSEHATTTVERILRQELSGLSEGRLTARLLPPGREAIATIVREDNGARSRIDIPAASLEDLPPTPLSGATAKRLSNSGSAPT